MSEDEKSLDEKMSVAPIEVALTEEQLIEIVGQKHAYRYINTELPKRRYLLVRRNRSDPIYDVRYSYRAHENDWLVAYAEIEIMNIDIKKLKKLGNVGGVKKE